MFLSELLVDLAILEVFFHFGELSCANLTFSLFFCALCGFKLLLGVAYRWLRRVEFLLNLWKMLSSTIKSVFGWFKLLLGFWPLLLASSLHKSLFWSPCSIFGSLFFVQCFLNLLLDMLIAVCFNVLEVIVSMDMVASKYILLSINLLCNMVVSIRIVSLMSINFWVH